jgi:pimeloyl-ACP methyl ester carboxylesterase
MTAFLVAGCSSSEDPNVASPTSRSPRQTAGAPHRQHPDCLAGLPRHDVKVPAKRPVTIRLVGHGHTVVVLSNQSNVDLCAWQIEAARLYRQGYVVALYDYVSATETDLTNVARYLRAHGATRLVLVGASVGAMTSVMAAAHIPEPPAAVVALSAEASLGGASVAPAARTLTSPALYVTARQDPYGSGPTSRAYAEDSPNPASRLVTLGGTAHGIALLQYHHVAASLAVFLARVVPVRRPATHRPHAPECISASCPGFSI